MREHLDRLLEYAYPLPYAHRAARGVARCCFALGEDGVREALESEGTQDLVSRSSRMVH